METRPSSRGCRSDSSTCCWKNLEAVKEADAGDSLGDQLQRAVNLISW
jgi:hypothetical protein